MIFISLLGCFDKQGIDSSSSIDTSVPEPAQEPSSEMSSEPTSEPTSQPSRTYEPTGLGETTRPTSAPSSMPSHIIDGYTESKTYADLQLKYDQYLSDTAELLPTAVNFHTFYYKTKTVEGSCDDWRYVTESLLVPPSEEFYISQLSVSFDTQHDINRYYNDTASTYVF